MVFPKLVIEGLNGERTLSGSIKVNGSKNGAVQALAASLLFEDELMLDNLPAIEDIARLVQLLEELGIKAEKGPSRRLKLQTAKLEKTVLNEKLAKSIRASILLTGPLLAREGEVSFPFPGGCVIGTRPIDLFLNGYRAMGATIEESVSGYALKAPPGGLRGAEIFFKNQTVTGTETFILTAILAQGRTVLKNCALEPEIASLGEFLIEAGAKISGLGTTTITIDGGTLLKGGGQTYSIIPDRIEAGSFLVLGALAARELTVTDCEPAHLESLIEHLRLVGAPVTVGEREVTISGDFLPRGIRLVTHEYPGFPTDLQSPFAVLLTQAEGESAIFETIFEGRLLYLETLNLMGATTKVLNPHEAEIKGPTKLKGRPVESPDLRAGLAYVLAGIIARGQTVVHNLQVIDRGYERIDERLSALGLLLRRELA